MEVPVVPKKYRAPVVPSFSKLQPSTAALPPSQLEAGSTLVELPTLTTLEVKLSRVGMALSTHEVQEVWEKVMYKEVDLDDATEDKTAGNPIRGNIIKATQGELEDIAREKNYLKAVKLDNTEGLVHHWDTQIFRTIDLGAEPSSQTDEMFLNQTVQASSLPACSS